MMSVKKFNVKVGRVTVLLFLCSAIGFAQQFSASVTANPVAVGETFQLTFAFSGDDVNNLSAFQAPAMKEFIILSGPNQSSSFQWVNGVSSSTKSFSYYVQAKEKGKFTIGAAEAVFKGKKYTTKPIVIEVAQGSQKPQANRRDAGQDVSGNIGDDVFIRAFADKSVAYPGEQITVTYKLYTTRQISSPQISKLPQYQGFWAEEITTATTINFSVESLNGRQFHSAVLKKAALFPTQSGKLTVTPFKLKIPVMVERRRRSNNPFDSFFDDPFFQQNQMVEYEAVSNQLGVQILPLPEPKPADFSGSTGKFTMDVSVDKRKSKQNEPVTLKIAIGGTGNIQLISPPAFELSSSLERYDPKVKDQINRDGLISGSRTFEFLIVPRLEGKYEVPAINFRYFDASAKQYRTVSSSAIPLEIEKGDGGFVSNPSGGGNAVQMVDKDIHYIKLSDGAVKKKGENIYNSFAGAAMIVFPIFSVIGTMIYLGRKKKLSLNPELMRNRKAERLAKVKLKEAARDLKAKNVEKFYADLFTGLTGYAEHKYNIPRSEFSIGFLSERMTQLGLSEQLVGDFLNALNQCEVARYAPFIERESGMPMLYADAVRVIVSSEDELSRMKRGRA